MAYTKWTMQNFENRITPALPIEHFSPLKEHSNYEAASLWGFLLFLGFFHAKILSSLSCKLRGAFFKQQSPFYFWSF